MIDDSYRYCCSAVVVVVVGNFPTVAAVMDVVIVMDVVDVDSCNSVAVVVVVVLASACVVSVVELAAVGCGNILVLVDRSKFNTRKYYKLKLDRKNCFTTVPPLLNLANVIIMNKHINVLVQIHALYCR